MTLLDIPRQDVWRRTEAMAPLGFFSNEGHPGDLGRILDGDLGRILDSVASYSFAVAGA
jgi:hypothetical protein